VTKKLADQQQQEIEATSTSTTRKTRTNFDNNNNNDEDEDNLFGVVSPPMKKQRRQTNSMNSSPSTMRLFPQPDNSIIQTPQEENEHLPLFLA